MAKKRAQDFEFMGKLGTGSFGTVHKVRKKSDGGIYVMKLIVISAMNKVSRQEALNEVHILSSLDHPYIVKYYDYFIENKTLHILMEYCERGDLNKHLKAQAGRPMPENRIWKFFIQICMGLEYLHGQKVLHRDIKSMNVFLTKDDSVRIGDLGVAKVLSNTSAFARTMVGTPFYLSPELCEEKPYNIKSDVWALGCVLYELWTFRPPFNAANQGALILKIIKGNYAAISATYSNELRQVVDAWLWKNYRRRPNIGTLLTKNTIKEKALSQKIFVPGNSVLYPLINSAQPQAPAASIFKQDAPQPAKPGYRPGVPAVAAPKPAVPVQAAPKPAVPLQAAPKPAVPVQVGQKRIARANSYDAPPQQPSPQVPAQPIIQPQRLAYRADQKARVAQNAAPKSNKSQEAPDKIIFNAQRAKPAVPVRRPAPSSRPQSGKPVTKPLEVGKPRPVVKNFAQKKREAKEAEIQAVIDLPDWTTKKPSVNDLRNVKVEEKKKEPTVYYSGNTIQRVVKEGTNKPITRPGLEKSKSVSDQAVEQHAVKAEPASAPLSVQREIDQAQKIAQQVSTNARSSVAKSTSEQARNSPIKLVPPPPDSPPESPGKKTKAVPVQRKSEPQPIVSRVPIKQAQPMNSTSNYENFTETESSPPQATPPDDMKVSSDDELSSEGEQESTTQAPSSQPSLAFEAQVLDPTALEEEMKYETLNTIDWNITAYTKEEEPPTINAADNHVYNINQIRYGDDMDSLESDNELYEISDDSEDEKVEKLSELERKEKQLQTQVTAKVQECKSIIGLAEFNEFYKFFKEKLRTSDDLSEADQEEIDDFVYKRVPEENTEVILVLYKILYQEIELARVQDQIRNLRFELVQDKLYKMEGVTEEQVNGITQMLTSILGVDNEIRKVKEAEFTALRKQHPASVVVCLIVILRNCPDARVRGLAAVLIRQTVTLFTAEDRNTWKELTPEQKVYIKENVIQAAQLESEKSVRNRIADTMGEIAGTAMRNTEAWPEVFQYVVLAGASDQPGQVALALKICNGLCIYATKQLVEFNQQLYSIFAASLVSENSDVQENAVEALCNFLTAVDSKDTEIFSTLLTPLLQGVTAIITKDQTQGKESLEFLTYVADAEYKYFKNDMATVFAFVQHICWMTDLDDLGVKYLALEFYTTILQSSSAQLLTDMDTFTKLVDCIFKMMLEVDVEIDDSWSNPAEGFEDKDDDEVEIDYAKLGNKMLTRLLQNTVIEGSLNYILSLVQKTLSNSEDWRMKYTAIMTLSEMVARISEQAKIAELVQIVAQHIDLSFHGKIRYAAYGCVASLCEEKEEVFQATYHEQVVAMIITGLQDPIPRVQSQVLYLTSCFFEGAVKTLAAQYAPTFIPKLVEIIGSQCSSIVKEYALTALAGLAAAAKDKFAQYYTQVVPILIQIIQSYEDPVYKTLRGKCIECLSLVATSIGREQFAPYAPEITALLYNIQNALADQKDPQTEYILTAWSKIAYTMKEDFSPYLANVLPGLFKLANLSAEQTFATTDEDVSLDIQALAGDLTKKPKISITTMALDTKCVAIRTIKTIIQYCGGAFSPFTEAAMPLLIQGVQFRVNENIRSYASEAIGHLVESEVNSGKPEALQNAILLSKNFLGVIWAAIDCEFETNAKVTHLDTVKTIISAIPMPFLTQEEVDEMGRRVVNLIKATLANRAKLQQEKTTTEDETDSEGDDEFYEEMVKSEEDSLHTEVSELLGAIFKTHKEQSLPFVQYFFTDMMQPFLDTTASNIDHKFAIFVIDDIIEFLGESLAITQWPYLADAIMKFALSEDEVVRQASVYGIGVLAGASSKEFFGQIAAQCIDLLQQASMMQGVDITAVGHAKDNAVASMAKILKHQPENAPIESGLAGIINWLPLRYDKEEARFTHDFLADLCTLRQDLIAPHVTRVIRIFAELLETKFITEETTAKVKTYFVGLQAAGQLTGEGLTEMMKGKIQACLNSN